MSFEDGMIVEIVARKERIALGIRDCKSGGNEFLPPPLASLHFSSLFQLQLGFFLFHFSVQCTLHSPHTHPPIHKKAESCKTLQLKQWQILRC